MRKLIATLILTGALAVPAAANAYDYNQAHAAAAVWINNHCGDASYKCEWWIIGAVNPTGINQRGRKQWTFTGNDSEGLTVRNPFLPRYQACTFFGGVDPYGAILGGGKICSPE